MAFSLSGSTITQTGTDTDLSGLIGLAGVDSIGGDDMISASGLRLRVEGTLTIPEKCVSFSRITVAGSGDLTVGLADSNGATQPTTVETLSSTNWTVGSAGFGIESGGTLRLRHCRLHQGSIQGGTSHSFLGGTGLDYNLEVDETFITMIEKKFNYMPGSNATIRGLTLTNTSGVFFTRGGPSIERLNFINTDWGPGIPQTGPSSITVRISGSRLPRAFLHGTNRVLEHLDNQITDWVACRTASSATSFHRFFRTIRAAAVGPQAGTDTTVYVRASDGSELASSALDANGNVDQIVQWGGSADLSPRS